MLLYKKKSLLNKILLVLWFELILIIPPGAHEIEEKSKMKQIKEKRKYD